MARKRAEKQTIDEVNNAVISFARQRQSTVEECIDERAAVYCEHHGFATTLTIMLRKREVVAMLYASLNVEGLMDGDTPERHKGNHNVQKQC